MEEDTEIKSFGEGHTENRNIRTLHHSWTRGPGVANTTFRVYRIDTNGITKRKENTILQVIQYVQARVGHGSQAKATATRQKAKGVYAFF